MTRRVIRAKNVAVAKIVLLLPAFLLSSCGSPSQPDCAGRDAQETIHRLAAQWLRQSWYDVGRAYGELFNSGMTADRFGTWADLLVHSESIPTAKRIVDIVEGLSESMQPLANVRTTGTNDELRWRSCAATLPMQYDGTEMRLPVQYTAQYTEDGQLWVELTSVF